MSTKNIKQLIKAKGDNTFERAMRMYGIKPKEAEKIFKSTDWTNVDSGGGSGSGESTSTIEYWDVSGVDASIKLSLCLLCHLIKIPEEIVIEKSEGPNTSTTRVDKGVVPAGLAMSVVGQVGISTADGKTLFDGFTALSIDLSTEIWMQEQIVKLSDVFAMTGLSSIIAGIPRITKEQFYDLNA